MALWISHIFVSSVGVRCIIIHAEMPMKEVAKAINEFNHTASNIKVLLITYDCVSTDLSLHKHCHHVVLMESAKDINTERQAIGCIHRRGQRKEQKVWRLFTNNTYDRSGDFSGKRKRDK